MATATPKKLWPARCSCPYWSPCTSSCLLVESDLFIPLKNHVALYCSSGRFALCPTYLHLTEAASQPQAAEEKPIKRRRSVRIPCHHPFRFSQVVNRQPADMQENTSWILDVSDHGLRFASDQSLSQETTICFCIEDEATATKIEGVGRVVWSAPLNNTSLYQVGVAFKDEFRGGPTSLGAQ